MATNRWSYSGADARVYTFISGMPQDIREVESLHTISWSIHEAKGMARTLGRRGISGISRGIRTIAGSMIMTVVEDNPLRPFMDNYMKARAAHQLPELGWSLDMDLDGTGSAFDTLDFTNRLAPLLPPCSIIIEYISEASSWSPDVGTGNFQTPGAAFMLQGLEFVDEGGVTSVQDIVTEVTLSFIAVDMKPLSINRFRNGDLAILENVNPYDPRELDLKRRLEDSWKTSTGRGPEPVPLQPGAVPPWALRG